MNFFIIMGWSSCSSWLITMVTFLTFTMIKLTQDEKDNRLVLDVYWDDTQVMEVEAVPGYSKSSTYLRDNKSAPHGITVFLVMSIIYIVGLTCISACYWSGRNDILDEIEHSSELTRIPTHRMIKNDKTKPNYQALVSKKSFLKHSSLKYLVICWLVVILLHFTVTQLVDFSHLRYQSATGIDNWKFDRESTFSLSIYNNETKQTEIVASETVRCEDNQLPIFQLIPRQENIPNVENCTQVSSSLVDEKYIICCANTTVKQEYFSTQYLDTYRTETLNFGFYFLAFGLVILLMYCHYFPERTYYLKYYPHANRNRIIDLST